VKYIYVLFLFLIPGLSFAVIDGLPLPPVVIVPVTPPGGFGKSAYVVDVKLSRHNNVVITFDRSVINTDSSFCAPIQLAGSGFPEDYSFNMLVVDVSTDMGQAIQSMASLAMTTGRKAGINGQDDCPSVDGVTYQTISFISLF
jgi:hypothetical protein